MPSARALALPLALAAGCSVSEESWPKDYAKAFCSFQKRCTKAEFFYDYDNETDCVDKMLTRWDEYGAASTAGCSFDESNAQKCIDALNLSCEQFADDYDPATYYTICDDAWSCTSVYGG